MLLNAGGTAVARCALPQVLMGSSLSDIDKRRMLQTLAACNCWEALLEPFSCKQHELLGWLRYIATKLIYPALKPGHPSQISCARVMPRNRHRVRNKYGKRLAPDLLVPSPADRIRGFLRMTPAQWRHLLTAAPKSVDNQEWSVVVRNMGCVLR